MKKYFSIQVTSHHFTTTKDVYVECELPGYITEDILERILRNVSPYKTYIKQDPCPWRNPESVLKSLEEVVEAVKNVSLFRRSYCCKEMGEIEYFKEFILPPCFEVHYKNKVKTLPTENTITYFTWECAGGSTPTCEYIDHVKDELGIRFSCAGNYYLVGRWSVVKHCTKDNCWVFIKWEEKDVIADILLDY